MTFFSYTSSFFYTNDVALVLDQMRAYPLWLMILVVGVTPAITEEITIRGIALSGFEFKSKNVVCNNDRNNVWYSSFKCTSIFICYSHGNNFSLCSKSYRKNIFYQC